MNTAAPTSTHNIRQDAYAAERISAQEAMKGMRISEPHQVRSYSSYHALSLYPAFLFLSPVSFLQAIRILLFVSY